MSPKLSDRLSQIYILHRAYLTLLRVARYKCGHPTRCLLCGQEAGTFFHLIWTCPKIQGLWTQVITYLHDTMGSPVALDPKQCLLGIFPDTIDKLTKVFLHETLFSVRKIIAKKWMRPLSPTFTDWKVDVNSALPYNKCIYVNRCCPVKYNKIWDSRNQKPEHNIPTWN